jgi:23S rRNA (pseudouridine1915-N3)-methyltransferase
VKISVWTIGKTTEKYLQVGIETYVKRLGFYTRFHYEEWKDVKAGQHPEETTKREGEMILSKLKPEDSLVLLDEKGKIVTSKGLATILEKSTVQSEKHLIFLIGGAYGHHPLLRQRANDVISLSPMTFTHQMARLILVEQLYRAFTIIRNEKYHNP